MDILILILVLASAGKTLTFITGIAQQEGYLNIHDTTSNYLGSGWTNCVPIDEENYLFGINRLRHLDYPFCTDDTCLNYLADAGTRWAYHEAPYTLRPVVENATNQGFNLYAYQKILNPTGMDGLFVYNGYGNIFL